MIDLLTVLSKIKSDCDAEPAGGNANRRVTGAGDFFPIDTF
jgi:hypothetical protein